MPLYADTASVVLSRVAPSGVGAAVAAVDALSGLGATLDTATVLERIFDTLQLVVGSASGFCTLFRGGTMRVAYYRAVERERLVAAAKRPEFREMVSSREIRVDPPNHPVVELVARLGEVAVGLPLVADGRPVGHVVVLLPAPPDSDRRALLAAFARHAANVLRAAEVFDQLGEHEEQLSATVHSMANPVVVVDSSGRAVEVNGAAAELFRLASTFEVGHPIAGKLGSELLESMLADGSDRTAEVVLGTEEPRVYRATVRRMRAAGGRAMGSILVLDDLTSERELDAKKADFVAVIGHELRTPLTVMKGYLQTLTKRWESLTDERRGKALDALEDNLSRLERLIDDLLFISAVEQRKCTVDLAMTDVGALLEASAGHGARSRSSSTRPRSARSSTISSTTP